MSGTLLTSSYGMSCGGAGAGAGRLRSVARARARVGGGVGGRGGRAGRGRAREREGVGVGGGGRGGGEGRGGARARGGGGGGGGADPRASSLGCADGGAGGRAGWGGGRARGMRGGRARGAARASGVPEGAEARPSLPSVSSRPSSATMVYHVGRSGMCLSIRCVPLSFTEHEPMAGRHSASPSSWSYTRTRISEACSTGCGSCRSVRTVSYHCGLHVGSVVRVWPA